MRLSIAIPIYNFARFVPLTLDSIVAQDRVDEVEIVVVDGASTDDTPQVMEAYCAAHPQVRYVRLPQKGGIDRDMAIAFGQTSGDYCWLFSGDDIMFAINIPQESVTIPETIDGIRAAMSLQTDRLEAVGATNKYLNMKCRA